MQAGMYPYAVQQQPMYQPYQQPAQVYQPVQQVSETLPVISNTGKGGGKSGGKNGKSQPLRTQFQLSYDEMCAWYNGYMRKVFLLSLLFSRNYLMS